MKIVLHNDNNENNNNGLLSIIKKGKVILTTVFNNAFLQNNGEDFKEVESDVFNSLPEELKSEFADGKTYVLDFIDDSINAANSTKTAVDSPGVKTIYKAIKDDAELVKDIVEFIRFAKQRRKENKAVKNVEDPKTKKAPAKKATVAKKNTPERPVKRTKKALD